MIIKRTKIVDNDTGSVESNALMKQIILNTKANIKTEMKNKNKFSEENNHACF
jgi:hypothetical protein